MVARHDFFVEGQGFEFHSSYKDGSRHEALLAMVYILEAHVNSLKDQVAKPPIDVEQAEAHVTGVNGFVNGGFSRQHRRISKDVKAKISHRVKNTNHTYKEIARDFGVSISTVARLAIAR